MDIQKFDCGCEFTVIDGQIQLETDIEQVNLNCSATWDLISSGRTTGLFQIESQLGKSVSKQLKPKDIEGLALLIAAIRPGCLDATLNDGKSVTQHIIKRYNGEEPLVYEHPLLEEILKDTMAVLVYQESALLVVQKIAGFSLSEADTLRKAIGKKQVDVMAQVKTKFFEGCKKVGLVTPEEAEAIWASIEASQRYSFNKCLSPDTLVELEDDAFVALSDVQVGDVIKTINNEYTTITHIYNNGPKEIYEVTLESGKTINCTLGHKFLCEDGKKYSLIDILEKSFKIVTDKE